MGTGRMSLDLVARMREERAIAYQNAQHLPEEVFQRWERCRSSHRFVAYQGKEVVAYRLLFLVPEVTNVFTCKGLDVSLTSGLSSLWEDRNGKQFWVSARPVEVADNCFFWMLKYSNLEYGDWAGQKSLKFPVCYGTERNPQDKIDGIRYLLERAVFDDTFKQQN